MAETLTPVECRLHDCVFYTTDPAQPGQVLCKHVEKPHYLKANPCPLYRLDWQKKAPSNPNNFLKMIKRK